VLLGASSPAGGSPRRRQQQHHAAACIPEDSANLTGVCGVLGGTHEQQSFAEGNDINSRPPNYGMLADSPFASQGELMPLSRMHSMQLTSQVSAKEGSLQAADTAAAAGDLEQGLSGLSGTAASTGFAESEAAAAAAAAADACSRLQRLWQQLLQLMTWQGLKQAGSSFADAVRCWWQQQPKQQLLLVLASFAVYAVVNGVLAVLPKCGAALYAVLGVFLLATVALTVAATWLQWGAAAAAAAGTAEQIDWELLDLEAAAKSAAAMPGVVKSADVMLLMDQSQGSPRKQQQQQEPGSKSCIAAAGQNASELGESGKVHNEEDRESIASTTSSGLTDSEELAGNSSSSNAVAAGTGSLFKQQAAAAVCEPAEQPQELQLNQPYDEIIWTRGLLLGMPAGMFVVGLISGLLGCSPNTLFLTPLLLELNCHPQVGGYVLALSSFVSIFV
jgi:hypothetical protein